METSDFYDRRGEDALQIKFRGIGSQSIPEKFRAPYAYFEEKLPLPEIGRSFLDIGCGTGVHSIQPAQLGYEVTGIDLSNLSVEAANYIADQYGVAKRAKFLVANAIEFLKNKNTKFDVIFTSGSLYYFDLKEIVPLIKNKLKPNGHFFCIETNGSNWLLNQARKLRHNEETRDERTMKNLLTLNDVEYLKSQFPVSEVKYFGVYNLPVFPSMSFKFVFHGQLMTEVSQ